MAGISLITGPQDPSQLEALLNQVIAAVNGFLVGGTPQVLPVVTGTTSANLPASGIVTLASTVASAAYTISAPVRGQTVRLISLSTKTCTITGLFNKTKTKLTLTTTASAKLPQLAVELVGLSTSAWGIAAVAGNVKST